MDELPPDVIADALKEEPAEGLGYEEAARTLVPMADRVRTTLSSITLMPVAKATPEQRTALVALREELVRVHGDTGAWIDAIDLSFRHGAIALGAREIPTADGAVKVEPVRDEVTVDVAGMKAELEEYARNSGTISVEEVGDIFTTVVEVKANGSKLNYFAKNRGEELAAIIERHRHRTPGNPLAAKLRFLHRG